MQVLNRKKYMKLVLVVAAILMLCRPVVAYPPDPDNASLLYYQAFLLFEQPDEVIGDMLRDIAKGQSEPNEEIREHVEKSKAAIELAASAARIPNCDWGLKYSDGMSMQMPYLAQARDLALLIAADSRILVEGSDIALALDRGLTLRRMGRHFGKTTLISYLVGCAIYGMSNDCLQNVLTNMSVDLETLDWLKNELNEIEAIPLSLGEAIDMEEMALGNYINREKVDELMPFIEYMAGGPELQKVVVDRIRSADDEFFRKNRDYWQNYMAGVRYAVKLPYRQAYPRLEELLGGLEEDVVKNPDASLTAVLAAPFFKPYSYGIRGKTHFNALMVAMDMYIARTKTDKFPDRLPIGSSKDLFSSEDFEYEKTADGFILLCQGKDLLKDEIHQYEFRVSK